MNFLESFLERIAELWPLKRVNAWEKGLLLRYGRVVRTCGPGIYFVWWWFEEMFIETVVQQVKNLPTQSITTQDDIAVSFSANITYEVSDVELKLTQVHDFDDSLVGLAMMHLAKRVREQSWTDLKDHQADLERSLQGTLTTRVKEWGVRIVGVGLTDCVKVKQFRLFGDPPFK